MSLDDIFDIWHEENARNSTLLSASIVVEDGESGEVRVYNSNKYGGIDSYTYTTSGYTAPTKTSTRTP